MHYEESGGLRLPKIGFGTWKIGGGSFADPSQDAKSMAALQAALQSGYTHFDTAEMYAGGHAEELLGRAIRESGAPRASLQITSKVKPEHLAYEQVLRACDASLKRLGFDTIDLYLIHWPRIGMKLKETFRALNQLVSEGKVGHVGVSNFDIPLLKESEALSATPIVTNQVPYSLGDRSYAQNGVLAYCQQRGIVLTAYEPVGKGRLHVEKTLRSIAEAHQKTPYQIALAWLAAQPRVIAIPMSFHPAHIQENFEAAEVALSAADMQLLT